MYEELSKYNWSLTGSNYAVTDDAEYFKVHRKRRQIAMHRLINQTPKGMMTDHINSNRLDNRKQNLRTVTQHQNTFNASKAKGMTSRYKGVSSKKGCNKWRAQIQFKGKTISLGYHFCEEDAARAYNEKAKEIYGEYAKLNQI